MKLSCGVSRSSRGLLGLVFLSSISSVVSVSPKYDPFATSARCPLPCSNSATDNSGWSHYTSIDKLTACNQTVLLGLNLYYGIDSETTPLPVTACTVQGSTPLKSRQTFSHGSQSNLSATTFESKSATKDIQILRWTGEGGSSDSASLIPAAEALATAVAARKNGVPTVLFAKSANTIIGLYAGSQIDNKGIGGIIKGFSQREGAGKTAKTAAQLCASDSLNTQILGLFVDVTGDLRSVQGAVRSWHDAKCLDGADELETWKDVSVALVAGTDIPVGPDTTSSEGVSKRATCSYTQAVAGDGCWALADRCKITQDELVSYNSPDLCTKSIVLGQYVCCSAGTLPDFTPQPNSDGTCKTYVIKSQDTCDQIASSNTMTVDQINERNKKTWGWTGCRWIIPDQIICLSAGTPPMPGANEDAVCGPTVPNTPKPANMDDLASLNPCPLNACCNIWGQCGISGEFCVESPADTGAPGAAVPGSNGCIYNCGADIVNNGEAPTSFKRVGYFEAWNADRPCLHMRASQINTNDYTHIHFAFGNITDSLQVDVSGLQKEFDEFKGLKGVKRVLSFGGWSFSTEYDTFPIFREGVTPEQRQTFANNVVGFILDQGLDGVDFDWEYPSAPDIPGIPAGSPEDGPNYLAFLKLVREALPSDKSIGIAAPASFWYLKGFPIDEIADVVDYIVYMTYDLHGQWDYANKWSIEGCAAGDCLRSHVNRTETEYALSMVTKAGVPSTKILVGMALYGRSFKMTTPGCYGPQCTYTGPESGATHGRCTDTGGYISNFEIREIIATNPSAQQYSDKDGDVLVYDDVQWVSWMTKELYNERLGWVRGLNFGGTSDWAIDLDADYGSDDQPGQGDSGSGPIYISPDIWSQQDPLVQCEPPCTFIFPPWVLPTPTTISMDPVTVTYTESWYTTITVSGAAITTAVGQVTSTVITVPPITTQTIDVSNVIWPTSSTDSPPGSTGSTSGVGIIWLTSSVEFPAITITQTRTEGDDRPLITWTYSPGPYPTPPTTSSPDPDDPDPTSTEPTSTTPFPPPPPTGFPSTVPVSNGPPKPTCTPETQVCGKPCQKDCGGGGGGGGGGGSHGCIGPPLLCPGDSNCVGFCSDGGGGGGGGGGDPNDPDESCRKKTTASYCSRRCSVLEYPSSTTTTCRDPDCTRTITACSATDSTTTSTTTLTCPTTTKPADNGNPGDLVPRIGDGGAGGFVVNPGQFSSMTNKPTGSPTGSPGPDPSMVAAIPDCLWTQVIQYTTTEAVDQGVSELYIQYQGTTFCNSYEYCDEYTSSNTPLLCKAAAASCSKVPAWTGYVSRDSKIANGLLVDWVGVTITGHPLSSSTDGPKDISAYYEVPLVSQERGDCGVTTLFSAKYDDCYELRYGGWFGGDCSKYPAFISNTELGILSELKKEDAVSKHDVF